MKHFSVWGKVQQVMFRQTLIRGCIKRNLECGASNLENNEVLFTIKGDSDKIEEIIKFLESGKKINDWGAYVTKLVEHKEGSKCLPIDKHQVTTKNVDSFKWNQNCKMFL